MSRIEEHGEPLRAEKEAFSDHLELLAVMNEDFIATLDIDGAMHRGLQRIVEYLGAEAGSMFLVAEDADGDLRCQACVGPVDVTGLRVPVGQGIVGRCVSSNAGEIVRNVAGDPQFRRSVDARTGFTTQSILCAPMSVQEERLGAIQVLNKRHGDGLFKPSDLNLLRVLSTSLALALRNARMAAQLVEQERLRHELELASEIQRNLLPSEEDPEFPVVGVNLPARGVSGDFYDFYALDDGRIYFCLGDVSGKGMDAALLMAKASSLFRCLGKTLHEPGRLLGQMNEEICETASFGRFITMAAGIYDPRDGSVRLANAGHEPPLIRRPTGEYASLPAQAAPLGISPMVVDNGTYPEEEFCLDGGTLYVFTDGVTEGYVRDREMLEVVGLKKILDSTARKAPCERLDRVVDTIRSGGAELHDDITLLAVEDAPAYRERGGASTKPRGRHSERGEAGEQLIGLRVPARADRLRLIRAAVGSAADLCGCSPKITQDMVIAIDEACQNVIRHGYRDGETGDMEIGIFRHESRMVFHVRDFSRILVDVEKVRPRDLDDLRPGGLGTHIIREVMEEVEFLRPALGQGNLLRMAKTIG